MTHTETPHSKIGHVRQKALKSLLHHIEDLIEGDHPEKYAAIKACANAYKSINR